MVLSPLAVLLLAQLLILLLGWVFFLSRQKKRLMQVVASGSGRPASDARKPVSAPREQAALVLNRLFAHQEKTLQNKDFNRSSCLEQQALVRNLAEALHIHLDDASSAAPTKKPTKDSVQAVSDELLSQKDLDAAIAGEAIEDDLDATMEALLGDDEPDTPASPPPTAKTPDELSEDDLLGSDEPLEGEDSSVMSEEIDFSDLLDEGASDRPASASSEKPPSPAPAPSDEDDDMDFDFTDIEEEMLADENEAQGKK